jgi:ribosomal protein L40E
MAQKVVGYEKLEWTCPNCGSRNPGPQQTCSGCGAAQPADVKFEQTQNAELVTRPEEIEQAKAGPDIHCAFCSARNPAGTQVCVNCGADLSKGVQRTTGEVVGAYKVEEPVQIPCPTCGALNQANALRCAKCGSPMKRAEAAPVPAAVEKKKSPLMIGGLAILGVLAALCVCVVLVLSLRTSTTAGVVQSASWRRSIAIEELGPVQKETWKDSLPAGARMGSCSLKYKDTADQPAAVATEACGTPYSVDKGNGFSEVVQDCKYNNYAESCSYTVDEWHKTDEAVLQGNDLNPAWPSPVLTSTQRQADRLEEYKVVFSSSKGAYTFTTTDSSLFAQCKIGTAWSLKINALNAVVSIQPK